MKNKDGKITIKSIYKYLRSDKGKKYSFFIFYFFFFIFLFIFMATLNGNQVNNSNNNKESLPFQISNLENNYDFKYQLKIDNDLKEYIGKKDNLSIILEENENIYKYLYQNNELVKDSDNNLDLYYKFLDIYNLRLLIKNSKYLSKTVFTDFKTIYNYTITNEELNKYFNLNCNNLDLENNIIIKTNSENYIEELELDLVNFVNNINNEGITSEDINNDLDNDSNNNEIIDKENSKYLEYKIKIIYGVSDEQSNTD